MEELFNTIQALNIDSAHDLFCFLMIRRKCIEFTSFFFAIISFRIYFSSIMPSE